MKVSIECTKAEIQGGFHGQLIVLITGATSKDLYREYLKLLRKEKKEEEKRSP